MAESEIAAVYARALFEAAEDAGTLESTAADLAAFAEAMRASKELTAVMRNPQVDSAVKKKIVAELTEGGDEIFVNGLKLLIDKLHADLVPEVNERFQELFREQQGVIEVEVTSAVELDEKTREGIRKRIEQATSKQVEMKESVREDIIGGLVLRFGAIIVDGSLRAKLEQLRARLAQAKIGSEDSFETAS